MKKNKTIMLVVLLMALFVLITSCSKNQIDFDNLPNDDNTVIVFKSASCGCCVGWANYAEDNGLETNLVIVDNLDSIKNKYNIPNDMRSCHTSVIGGYFVEGHIPIEAVNKLLKEKPDIDGIALSGMPSGSAGMPGVKNEEWIIYSIKDGKSEEFMRI